MCTLVYREPMEFAKVIYDVGSAWEVEDKSGCCVLDSLKSSCELVGYSCVQGVPVVQSAGDEGLRDRFSGVVQ